MTSESQEFQWTFRKLNGPETNLGLKKKDIWRIDLISHAWISPTCPLIFFPVMQNIHIK
jgi:hypothetical protein